ncbi:MAG TPA: ChaN family lipoprotein [Casimicrobiaceae bacterium]|nr:ChaN family lipoprotein [Casimicrobiaceae bacterium]
MPISFPALPHSKASTRRFVSALLVAALFALALPSSADSSQPAQILDVRDARFVTEQELVARLVHARYRLLGEIHDDPAHHAIRARLLEEIAQAGVHPAVVMEQFDLDHDDALRAAQQSGATAAHVAVAGALDRKGWQWPLHEPIIAAALAANLPLRAGNLPRSALFEPETTLGGNASLHTRFDSARWTPAQARTLRHDIVVDHCGQLPANVVPRLVLAQRLRDAGMAQALVDDATADGAILIAGNGHVRRDLGVPVYLDAEGGDAAAIMSVGFVEIEPAKLITSELARKLAKRYAVFDYVWLTPPVARPDPCEAFRRAPKRLH